MKILLGSRKRHYAAGVPIFLITAVLLWAMIGCTTSLEEYRLTISSTGGGNVTDPCEGTHYVSEGLTVILEVQPDDGYRFVGWTGDVGRIYDVEKTIAHIGIRGDYSITAEFEKIRECRLAVNATDGGRVTAPRRGVSTYNSSEEVKLEADEYVGFRFANWTGDVGTVVDVNAATTKIIMEGNYSVRANFEAEAAVNITDIGLETAIKAATRIYERPIYPSDLKKLKSLEAETRNVSDLTVLVYCTGLKKLYLDGNQLDDISPVANLKNLEELYLSRNQISDISPVANLTDLTGLYLSRNQISDVSPVANLTDLQQLYLSGNQISDISPLAGLTRLKELSLGSNRIDDISALANLSYLILLNLSNNRISNIESLVYNQGLSRGDKVYLYDALSYSPLSYGYVSANIAQLEVRGVIVEY